MHPTAPIRWRPSTLVRLAELFVLLPLLKVGLRRDGIERTAVRATTVRRGRRLLGPAGAAWTPADVAEAISLARLMLRWTVVPAKCLEQSLVVCWFMARRGVPAELVMAVRKYPFEAHAWARWDGVALTAPPERNPEQFRIITRYPLAAVGAAQ